MGKKLDLGLAILNGAIGDHLARTENGLATSMTLRAGDEDLAIERSAILKVYSTPSSRVVILLHGLMCTEDIWTHPGGGDYGSMLARDHGFTPLYVRYNTGLTLEENGRALDTLLGRLVAEYPVPLEEIVPIGYSMGGLLVRSACHVAGLAPSSPWLPLVRRALYVGTPHLGAPAERMGRFVSKLLRAMPEPVTQLVGQIADLRSDGVKDLGDAALRAGDRGVRDPAHPVPLLAGIRHYLVAGSLSTDVRLATLFGDAVVPLGSATYGASVDAATFALPPSHVRIVRGKSHVDIAHDPAVYEHLREWCAP